MDETLHLMTGDYYQLCADCTDNFSIEVTDKDDSCSGQALDRLQEAYDAMVADWDKASELVALYEEL